MNVEQCLQLFHSFGKIFRICQNIYIYVFACSQSPNIEYQNLLLLGQEFFSYLQSIGVPWDVLWMTAISSRKFTEILQSHCWVGHGANFWG